MIKVENKSRKEIADIGRRIGEAFADEKAGTVTMLTREQTIKGFEIMTEWFYRAGTLYTTSEIGEGYLAYWSKRAKPSMGPTLHMIKRLLCELPLKALIAMAQSGDEQYAKIFKKEHDYIAVSMVVVLREFQGKGYMRKILEQPFAEADIKDIPCILDTDTPLKVKNILDVEWNYVARKN